MHVIPPPLSWLDSSLYLSTIHHTYDDDDDVCYLPPPPLGDNEICPGDELVYNTLPSAIELESGVAVTGTIGCNEYQYYTMNGDAQYYN